MRDLPDSLENLTECLCDVKNMPLLQDPPLGHTLAKVDLCYKALPHYQSFVTKRETQVNRRIKEGEEAKRLEDERIQREIAKLKEEELKAKAAEVY